MRWWKEMRNQNDSRLGRQSSEHKGMSVTNHDVRIRNEVGKGDWTR